MYALLHFFWLDICIFMYSLLAFKTRHFAMEIQEMFILTRVPLLTQKALKCNAFCLPALFEEAYMHERKRNKKALKATTEQILAILPDDENAREILKTLSPFT